jgi:drug/metabolite transporter (DMT)-like permease
MTRNNYVAVSVNPATQKKEILPYLALAFGILSLSFSAIFVRWANAPGSIMAFYRLGIATLILAPVFFTKGSHIKVKNLGWGVLIFPLAGGFFTALDHAIWGSAMVYTSAANATLMNYAAPVWIALVAWLYFKEKLTRKFWIGLALTFFGVSVVLGSDFLINPEVGKGDLLAFISSFFYAGYFLVTQSGRKHLDTLSYIWLVGLASTFTLLIINLGLKIPLTGYPAQAYWAFLGAALLSQIGGYVSVGYALGHIPASVVSPTMISQPVLTAILAVPLLGERMYPAQIVGGLIVLVGIYWVNNSRKVG